MSSVSKQVTLPTPMAPQYLHSGVVFGVGADFRVLILVGGYADTTLLLLGKKWHTVRHTHNMAIFEAKRIVLISRHVIPQVREAGVGW